MGVEQRGLEELAGLLWHPFDEHSRVWHPPVILRIGGGDDVIKLTISDVNYDIFPIFLASIVPYE